MVTVIRSDPYGAAGIREAGDAISQSLLQRALKQRQQQQQSAGIQELISGLGENPTPQEFATSLARAMRAGAPPEMLKMVSELYGPRFKEQAKSASENDFLRSLGIDIPQPMGQQSSDASPMMDVLQSAALPSPVPMQGAMGIQQQESVAPTAQQPNNINDILGSLSDSQLAVMSGSQHQKAKALAQYELDRRKQSETSLRSDRDYAYKRAKPYLEQIDKDRKKIADQKESLDLMESALASGNLGFFSSDNLANMLGKYGEGLRSSSGATFNTAMKEFLVSDLGRLGGRPNQWIEQQISGALAKIGRSEEANKAVVSALRARVERDEQRIKLTDELNEKYRKEIGYEPGNIAAIVDKEMVPYQEQAQKKLAYDLRKVYEDENAGDLRSLINKKVPAGTPMTLQMGALFLEKYKTPEKARENAKKLGYTILDADEYRRLAQ